MLITTLYCVFSITTWSQDTVLTKRSFSSRHFSEVSIQLKQIVRDDIHEPQISSMGRSTQQSGVGDY